MQGGLTSRATVVLAQLDMWKTKMACRSLAGSMAGWLAGGGNIRHAWNFREEWHRSLLHHLTLSTKSFESRFALIAEGFLAKHFETDVRMLTWKACIWCNISETKMNPRVPNLKV